jgi:putative hydrolase of the HAD superfamily
MASATIPMASAIVVPVVVFDVVGTLLEPAPSVAAVYAAVGRRHGLDLAEDVIAQRFREAWKRQEAIDAAAIPPFATSRGREAARWRGIVADVFGAAAADEQIFADLWEAFARPAAWRPVAAGRRLIEEARREGREVALASNFDERLFRLAASVPPLTLADHVFASSDLGWRKPAPEFFRAVEARLGRRPDELLLVGDDPELDLAAGRRAGWHVRGVA